MKLRRQCKKCKRKLYLKNFKFNKDGHVRTVCINCSTDNKFEKYYMASIRCDGCGHYFAKSAPGERYCSDLCAEGKKKCKRCLEVRWLDEFQAERSMKKAICVYCIREKQRKAALPEEKYKKYKEQSRIRMRTPKTEKRKCHDCGKPTQNYRCNACWAKRQVPENNLSSAIDCEL